MKSKIFFATGLVALVFSLSAPTGVKADETGISERLTEMERRIQHLERRLDIKDREIAERDRMIQSLREDLDSGGMPSASAAGWTENVELYGLIETEVSYTDPEEGDSETDAVVATVELGAAVTFNDWISGDVLLLFEEDENDDNIAVDNATVTLALPDSPMALTLGRMYVPFGVFESNMVSDPLTLDFGETQETALLLAGEGEGVHGGVFLSNGSNSEDGDNRLDDFGAVIGFAGEGAGSEYGVDLAWMGDIGDTDMLGDTISENLEETKSEYTESPSGISASAYYRYDNFVLLAEYIAATERFQAGALRWSDILVPDPSAPSTQMAQMRGAEPSAWMIEAGFDFMMGTNQAVFAIGLQGTDEALGLDLPETRWLVSTSVELGENAGLAVEWAHDESYDMDDRYGCTYSNTMFDCTGTGVTRGTGGSSDTLTVQLAAEF